MALQGRPLHRSMDAACVLENKRGGSKIIHLHESRRGERLREGEIKFVTYAHIYLPPRDRRLSLPGWLVIRPDGLPVRIGSCKLAGAGAGNPGRRLGREPRTA